MNNKTLARARELAEYELAPVVYASAIGSLVDEVERLKAGLEYFADRDNWETGNGIPATFKTQWGDDQPWEYAAKLLRCYDEN